MFKRHPSSVSPGPFRKFMRDRSGTIALMTGFLLPVIVLAAGGATDITRAMSAKAQAQRALDSTVLSLARSGLTAEEIEERGPEMLRGNLLGRNLKAELITTDFNGDEDSNNDGKADSVSGTALVGTQAYFLSIIGEDTIEAAISGSATKPSALPFEISMVLDVSGSMNDNLNGQPRIERLKQSSIALFDTLEEQLSRRADISVALVPYSTSVNIGDIDNVILEGTSLAGRASPPPGDDVWGAERFRGTTATGFDINDENPNTRQIPFVTTAEIAHQTPVSRIQPLSDSRAVYQASVNDLTADGWTSAHMGMIWGVYSLSPNWNSVWPTNAKPYGAANKTIVILTDGAFNTTHAIGSRSTNDGETSNSYFQSACDLAKDRGIVIYAVALSLDTESEDRLATCVDNSGGELFTANSANSLRDSFVEIARKIGGLRLTE